mgnify:CR=1 FL=1|jgi:predicted benzoate:H+ symporter BenE
MFIDFVNGFDPMGFLMDSPPWVSFVVPGLVFVVALVVIMVLGVINPALVLASVIPFMVAWILGTFVVLWMVFQHTGVDREPLLALLMVLGFLSNSIVASVGVGVIFGFLGWLAERFGESEEPVEAVESERVKTYPPV